MAGLAASFGSGAMTNSIREIPNSQVLFLIGANPSEAHPVIAAKMRQALHKGAKLIVADPRRTEMAAKADFWLRLRPGTDIALINSLLHVIIKSQWHDQSFIDSCTVDFNKLLPIIETYTPEYASGITGIAPELIIRAAELYAKAPSAQIFYTLGITEHTCGTDNVMSLANLAMVTGNIGKPNSGVNPLRGQNNVQGACDMGALPNVLPGYQKITSEAARKKFEAAWQVQLSPQIGMMIPEMFDAAHTGKLKGMYIMGEDPVLTDADANHVRSALQSLDFLVVQNLFLTETAKLADVVLPAASFAEKEGTFTNTERRIQRVRQAIPPLPGCRTDGDIIMELARRLGCPMNYADSAAIMDEISLLTPSYAGVNHNRLEAVGLQWPVPDATHPGTQFLHQDGRFTCGLGVFHPIAYRPPAEEPDEVYPFLLTTGRILYHYNVTTPGYSRNLTKFSKEEKIWLHPADAAKLQITDGTRVRVSSRRGSVACAAALTDAVGEGIVWMSFHFAASPTNELTNGACDPVTKTYEYKVCAVRIAKEAETSIG